MKTLTLVVLGLALLAAGAVALSYSGLPNIAATVKEPAAIAWLIENTREQAIRRRAEQIRVPQLTGDARWRAGARAFDDMCALCHGAPGKRPFLGAGDMNPAPPDLAKVAPRRSSAELFWVVKNGIRMTGMPAWGASHTDRQIWDLVAFIRQLPKLSVNGYQEALRTAPEHAHEHGHAPGAQAHSARNPSPLQAVPRPQEPDAAVPEGDHASPWHLSDGPEHHGDGQVPHAH